MAWAEFDDCRFGNGTIRFVIRYDPDNRKIASVRCENVSPDRAAHITVTLGENTYTATCPPATVKTYNIPPGILNQLQLGIDETGAIVSTSNANFQVAYRG